MKNLGLDFVRRRPSASPLGWLLLLAGAVGVGAAAFDVVQARDELGVVRERLKLHERIASPGSRREVAPASPEMTEAWRRARGALDRPWGVWLDDLEASTQQRVALLGIEAQAAARVWRLSGEAASMNDVVHYLQRLRASPRVRSAVLATHEARADGAVPIVRFGVDVTWADPP